MIKTARFEPTIHTVGDILFFSFFDVLFTTLSSNGMLFLVNKTCINISL